MSLKKALQEITPESLGAAVESYVDKLLTLDDDEFNYETANRDEAYPALGGLSEMIVGIAGGRTGWDEERISHLRDGAGIVINALIELAESAEMPSTG